MKEITMETNKPYAEIIESSLTGWLAQSWDCNCFPQFGSLVTVRTKKRILLGIVYEIKTGSIDPVRYPFTYQKTEEELLREQPQIFEFLKTTFSCLLIGFQETDSIFYQLPPEPPKIHTFIHHAQQSLFEQFFSKATYLHLLFALSQNLSNLDELLLALLKYMKDAQLLTEKKLHDFIQVFSLLSGNDYRRLKLFLQRIEELK